jgi:putative transposase
MPTDNAFAESFKGRLRDECLSAHWFQSIEEARATLESWREEYNTERPHSSLGLKAPAEFAAAWQTSGPENSSS